MSSEVIIALFSLIGTMFGTYAGIYKSSQLINYKISQLEKKVEKHNNVIERMFIIEGKQVSTDDRLDKLECEVKEVRK